ncbi:hypothetical protein FRC11_007120 [Ceratobasidium sp. 423]|nr:hypothetical protein FRC11_007120 [Ceratobasidium sp. 423]
MTGHAGWYPPGQICYPPELPTYLQNVYDLKPVVGAPSDDEVIGIHAVIQAARKGSEIPGMHNPGLLMGLADHLFSVQMGCYVYTPALPSHIPIHLDPISGAPSDEEIMKAQDALQTYQEFRRIPSMFDARINMDLSQHLFDIQMGKPEPHAH